MPQEAASEYRLLTVVPQDRVLVSEYSSRLKGRQVVEVRPQVGGLIEKICIGEGEKVRRGQVLFVIDRVPYEAALLEARANVESARAGLASARLDLESTRILFERQVVQQYDLSSAENAVAAAEAVLAQAMAKETAAANNLSYTLVKSPVDGVSGMIPYRIGSLVGSSMAEPLVTVSDGSIIQAYFSLSESAFSGMMSRFGTPEAMLRETGEVSLRMADGTVYPLGGHLSAVSGIVDAGTGAITVRADFPNPDGVLRDGGSAAVIIPSAVEGAIVIPQGATYELQDKRFVYKVIDGHARSSEVRVSRLSNGTEYIVEEGLEEGDTIIAEGAGLVAEGAAVIKKTE